MPKQSSEGRFHANPKNASVGVEQKTDARYAFAEKTLLPLPFCSSQRPPTTSRRDGSSEVISFMSCQHFPSKYSCNVWQPLMAGAALHSCQHISLRSGSSLEVGPGYEHLPNSYIFWGRLPMAIRQVGKESAPELDSARFPVGRFPVSRRSFLLLLQLAKTNMASDKSVPCFWPTYRSFCKAQKVREPESRSIKGPALCATLHAMMPPNLRVLLLVLPPVIIGKKYARSSLRFCKKSCFHRLLF